MTTKQVTIQDTQYTTEEFTVCDDCGRELDPQGIRFTETNEDIRKENRKKLDLCSECFQMYNSNEKTEYIIKNKEKFKKWWDYSKGKYKPRNYTTIQSVKKLTKKLNYNIRVYFISSYIFYIPTLGYSLASIDTLSNLGLLLLILLSIFSLFQYKILSDSSKLYKTQQKVTEKLFDSE